MLKSKIITLSLVATTVLSAENIELPKVSVESSEMTEVSKKAQVSADLADALSKSVPSVDMSRRSSIANDVFIRGQKRDNISVDIDGTKICGACPNRMDPPTSHIVTHQISDIEVVEGPYDVENFGTLSGGLRIKTTEPTKEFYAQIDGGVGAWGYEKIGVTLNGGNDRIKALVTASYENSGQYEDGDGNTLTQQTAKNATVAGNRYQTQYLNEDAYDKASVMAKLSIATLQDQELHLSYTGNRSDDVLYADSPMDARYDDSNIYSMDYDINNINSAFKNLNIQYYYSDVDHAMDTKYRNAGAVNYKTAVFKTSMQGVKLKNNFDFDGIKLLVGLDASQRTWEGGSYMTTVATGAQHTPQDMLLHTQSNNQAIFAKLEKSFGALTLESGARYDMTDIDNDSAAAKDREFNALGINAIATYALDKQNKVFLGAGTASRVPDARELYIMNAGTGNQNLKQTTNTEIDAGYEATADAFYLRAKLFYSMLDDYIYFANSTFTNIDATVYGAELSGSYYVTDGLSLDAGMSYKRGKKDEAIAGQTDKDLADMAPLRGKVGVTYEYAKNSTAMMEVLMSDKWSDYDSNNGEQELAGWASLNAKITHEFGKMARLSVGVNNLLDATYAQSNTYNDLTLAMAGGGQKMLLNEPGRYLYANLNLKF